MNVWIRFSRWNSPLYRLVVERYDGYDGKVAWFLSYLGEEEVVLYTMMTCYI